MKNIAIQHGCSDLYSGASHSLLGLLKYIIEDGRYNPIVVLSKKGDIENELKKLNVSYYIIKQHEMWTLPQKHRMTMFERIKDIIRPIFCKIDVIKISFFLQKNNIKIVHINMLTCGMLARAAIKCKIPVIWHIREFVEEDLQCRFVNPKSKFELFNNATKLIAVSKTIKEKWKKFIKKEIVVIYNGIDIESEVEPTKHIGDMFKICIVGRICDGKNQMELVEAVSLLPKEMINKCKVFIWGNIEDEAYWEKIQSYIKVNKMENTVSYEGFSSNIREKLIEYDCMCICARQEAFGRTTIEGMMAGCLVIGANSGGTSELIEDNVTGFLYSPGNTQELSRILLKCMRDNLLTSIIQKRAWKYAFENYTAKRNTTKVLELFDSLF